MAAHLLNEAPSASIDARTGARPGRAQGLSSAVGGVPVLVADCAGRP